MNQENNQCKCLINKGLQCKNMASTKSGTNQKFCYLHQNCNKQETPKSPITKTSINARSPDNIPYITSLKELDKTIIMNTNIEDLPALYHTNTVWKNLIEQ